MEWPSLESILSIIDTSDDKARRITQAYAELQKAFETVFVIELLFHRSPSILISEFLCKLLFHSFQGRMSTLSFLILPSFDIKWPLFILFGGCCYKEKDVLHPEILEEMFLLSFFLSNILIQCYFLLVYLNYLGFVTASIQNLSFSSYLHHLSLHADLFS